MLFFGPCDGVSDGCADLTEGDLLGLNVVGCNIIYRGRVRRVIEVTNTAQRFVHNSITAAISYLVSWRHSSFG